MFIKKAQTTLASGLLATGITAASHSTPETLTKNQDAFVSYMRNNKYNLKPTPPKEYKGTLSIDNETKRFTCSDSVINNILSAIQNHKALALEVGEENTQIFMSISKEDIDNITQTLEGYYSLSSASTTTGIKEFEEPINNLVAGLLDIIKSNLYGDKNIEINKASKEITSPPLPSTSVMVEHNNSTESINTLSMQDYLANTNFNITCSHSGIQKEVNDYLNSNSSLKARLVAVEILRATCTREITKDTVLSFIGSLIWSAGVGAAFEFGAVPALLKTTFHEQTEGLTHSVGKAFIEGALSSIANFPAEVGDSIGVQALLKAAKGESPFEEGVKKMVIQACMAGTICMLAFIPLNAVKHLEMHNHILKATLVILLSIVAIYGAASVVPIDLASNKQDAKLALIQGMQDGTLNKAPITDENDAKKYIDNIMKLSGIFEIDKKIAQSSFALAPFLAIIPPILGPEISKAIDGKIENIMAIALSNPVEVNTLMMIILFSYFGIKNLGITSDQQKYDLLANKVIESAQQDIKDRNVTPISLQEIEAIMKPNTTKVGGAIINTLTATAKSPLTLIRYFAGINNNTAPYANLTSRATELV